MEHENIIRWFQDTAEKQGDNPCLRFKKDKIWRNLSWNETLQQVQNLSESLKKLGVGSKDRVALLANTRYEWTLFDMAILSLGAVTVPIYQSSTPDEILHIVNDSGSKVIIVENPTQLKKVQEIHSQASDLTHIVMIEGEGSGENILSYAEFEALSQGQESDFGLRSRQIGPDDLATLVYTSGTTGRPKGVMLTHGNITGEIKAVEGEFYLDPSKSGLLFLPLAHILARVIQFYQLAQGFTHAYAESIEKLGENIQEVKPHFMISVPRIFEKIYQNMLSTVESSPPTKQKIFFWAKKVGAEYSEKVRNKKPVPFGLKLRHGLASKLVYSKLHQKLGGRIEFFISGGAPLSQEIGEFFHGADVLVLEGYGLTETTAAININQRDDYCFGTVGKPVKGAEEKIAEDGEILVRGPMIAKGYWNRPEETAAAFQADGWFHTGDIGEFNERGFLKITDRKKDIIVTAGGKNIAPQNIENLIKTHPLISQVMVHGDKRKFLSALITLNPEAVPAKAKELGIEGNTFAQQALHPKMKEIVKDILDQFNKTLANHETIKKFAIMDRDFTIEGGELTPTMKVKRKVISERYQNILDKFYQD